MTIIIQRGIYEHNIIAKNTTKGYYRRSIAGVLHFWVEEGMSDGLMCEWNRDNVSIIYISCQYRHCILWYHNSYILINCTT
jgi:hypothetical protein